MTKSTAPIALMTAFKLYWWAVLATLLSSVGSAFIYLQTASPKFESQASVAVENKDVSLSNLGLALTDTTELGGADPIVTEAELIQSQGVLQHALEIYGQSLSPEQVEQLPSTQELKEALQVKILPATSILELTFQGENAALVAGLLNAVAQAAVDNNIEVNRTRASAVRSFLEEQIPTQATLLAQAEAAESNYRQSYGLVAIDTQTQQLVTSLATLENEKRQITLQLREATERGTRLGQVTGVQAPSEAYTAVQVGQDPYLQDLRSQLSDLSLTLSEARSRLGDLHPDLLALEDQYEEVRDLYEQRLGSLTQGVPLSQAMMSASGELSQQLMADFITSELTVDALESRLAIVRSDINRIQTQLIDLPARAQPLSRLVREREAAEESLKLLQSKLEEAEIAEAQLVSNVRVVGFAEPAIESISPKPAVVMLLALVAGGALGVGLIFLLDMLDDSVRSDDEAEKLSQTTVLADLSDTCLPVGPDLQKALEAFLDNPTQVDSYRTLLRNLVTQGEVQQQVAVQHSEASVNNNSFQDQQAGQIFAFTSPTVNLNQPALVLSLAAVSSMLGRRTLVIDADPRSPIADYYMGYQSTHHSRHRIGLNEVVTQGKPLAQAILEPAKMNNLSILPYGESMGRHSTMIESPVLITQLRDAAKTYDLVLINLDSTADSADAATLNDCLTGLVLVTQSRVTARSALTQAVEKLHRGQIPLLGIVMNGRVTFSNQSPLTSIKQTVLSS